MGCIEHPRNTNKGETKLFLEAGFVGKSRKWINQDMTNLNAWQPEVDIQDGTR